MLCSCVIFNNICQQSCTDLEKFLPSGKCSITIGRTVLELNALGVLWRRVSREWRRVLEIFQVMISK